MAGSITVKDVAREADVSVGTVSRVFNNHNSVTEEVRQRVFKAAAKLGYFGYNRQETQSLKEICFLFYSSSVHVTPVTADPFSFWSRILHGAESEARKSNIKVTYVSIGELSQTPEALLTSLYDLKVGGLLLVGPATTEIVRLLQNLQLPLVLVDNYLSGFPVDAVLCDNFEGARAAVEYLISEGHRRIAFIGGPLLEGAPRPINTIYTIERRAAGYRTALLDAGLPVDYAIYAEGDLTPQGGYQVCKRLLEQHGPTAFTALFCANDDTAIGAMKALREAGLRVPEDVSLVGFDDIAIVEHLSPALTTVRVNKEAMGYTAVKSLLSRRADPDAASVTSILAAELIKRDSVSTYHE